MIKLLPSQNIKSTNQKYSDDDDITNLSNHFINYLVQSELS